MYKVFIENITLKFLSKEEKSIKNELLFCESEQKQSLSCLKNIIALLSEKEISINYLCENPKSSFEEYFKTFDKIEAAGGIVKRKSSYLFIKRNGFWDIPKGKIDEGESPEVAAVREIEEECGVKGAVIQNELCQTYHTYSFKGKPTIKKTYWFALEYNGPKVEVPQLEEGITKVKWMKQHKITKVLDNTFPSIVDVIDSYFQ
jgi:8-oxo-dGTP pyrophosphatase MutT (NUDIX family)